MKRRSFRLMAAFGLVASLAFATPSQAGSYVINVSEGFSVYNTSYTNSITSVALTFSGLTGVTPISAVVFTGAAIDLGSSTPVVTPTYSISEGTETITLKFSPSVFSVGGSLSFDTTASTDVVSTLASEIKLTSETIETGPSSDYAKSFMAPHFAVPEPASMSLLGIGMAGFFALRRFFTRRTIGV